MEDYIIPKKIVHTNKRGAPQDDHSSVEDTPKNVCDNDEDDAEDTLQDGLGNPNISGITPPIPANLIEPVLQAHQTHFHVVTSGTEVGIFTNKYVYHFCLVVSCLLTLY